jgi:hypothetical protein
MNEKNLYQTCKNKVTVNFSTSWKIEDIQKIHEYLLHQPDSFENHELLSIICDVEKAITKVLKY